MEQLLINLAVGMIAGVIETVRASQTHSAEEKKAILDSISAKLDAAGIRVAAAEIRKV